MGGKLSATCMMKQLLPLTHRTTCSTIHTVCSQRQAAQLYSTVQHQGAQIRLLPVAPTAARSMVHSARSLRARRRCLGDAKRRWLQLRSSGADDRVNFLKQRAGKGVQDKINSPPAHRAERQRARSKQRLAHRGCSQHAPAVRAATAVHERSPQTAWVLHRQTAGGGEEWAANSSARVVAVGSNSYITSVAMRHPIDSPGQQETASAASRGSCAAGQDARASDGASFWVFLR